MSNNYTSTIVGILLLMQLMSLTTSCLEAEKIDAKTADSSLPSSKQTIHEPINKLLDQQNKQQPLSPTTTLLPKPTTTVSKGQSPAASTFPKRQSISTTIARQPTTTLVKSPTQKGTYRAKRVKPNNKIYKAPRKTAELYLMDKAQKHLEKPHIFAKKVRKMATQLDIPPSWIMAIIHSESNFEASSKNKKGSGAKGLIQFMPKTCKSLGMTKFPESAVDQLEFVYKYFKTCQKQKGKFRNPTDLKLSVLYPKAIGKSDSYALYSKPSIAYRQNQGLDKNKDGSVTVADINTYMKSTYPDLYYKNSRHKNRKSKI